MATPNISKQLKTVKGLDHSTRSARAQRKLKELPKPVPKQLDTAP